METLEGEESIELKSVSVIGANISITGNIEAMGDANLADLQLEGQVKGDVRCATLILTGSSVVTGNIQADRVRVSGIVEGDIQTADLAVEGTGRVHGDVVYERIRIAAGAVVHGTMKWRGGGVAETSRLKLVEADTPKSIRIE
ncbi:MAG TPA: polymer-forming cytoskeletal protein [Allosphingosinicella sp.]|jgi:cytoskeletal protein CcmA (bactofilin family)